MSLVLFLSVVCAAAASFPRVVLAQWGGGGTNAVVIHPLDGHPLGLPDEFMRKYAAGASSSPSPLDPAAASSAAARRTWVEPAVEPPAPLSAADAQARCEGHRAAHPGVADACRSCTLTHPCSWCEARQACVGPSSTACASGWVALPPQCPASFGQADAKQPAPALNQYGRLMPPPRLYTVQAVPAAYAAGCRAHADCHSCSAQQPCMWCDASRSCGHASLGGCASGWRGAGACPLPSWFRRADDFGLPAPAGPISPSFNTVGAVESGGA